MSSRRLRLWVTAVIFGVLALIFYFTSIKQLDRETSRLVGTSNVVNIQGTVFAAACAVLCGLNVVGAIIVGAVEDNQSYSGPSASSVAKDVVNAINDKEKAQKKEAEEQLASEKKREEIRQKTEEMRQKVANGDLVEEQAFLEDIADENSMMSIWKKWKEYNLAESHTEADAFIKKYKEAERLYGKLGNTEELKEQLKALLIG